MADNYVTFSEEITLKNTEELAWVKEHLGFFRKFHSYFEDKPDLEFEKHPEFSKFEKLCDKYDLEWDWDKLQFEYEISDESIWIYSEGFSDVEQAIRFMQEFLRANRPNDRLHITWAFTCSKPRIGEFGGGAAVITAEKIHSIDLYEWVLEKKNAIH